MDPEIVITSDGSHTLHVAELNENYHSTHGALKESQHVFIRAGLERVTFPPEIRVLEVGLGTGLNVLLTIKAAEQSGKRISYTAIEAFPLSLNVTRQLNYPGLLDHPKATEWFVGIHASDWGAETSIAPGFMLTKIHTTLQSVELPGNFFDVVYFDAFAPQKQPELWTQEVFAKMFNAMRDEACLVTYCAKGQVKRDLRAAGFMVESLPGPPGKREMIRATRRNS